MSRGITRREQRKLDKAKAEESAAEEKAAADAVAARPAAGIGLFIDELDFKRCPLCTCRPPCKHISRHEAVAKYEDARQSLPRRPGADPCFTFQQTGSCWHGEACLYDHHPSMIPWPTPPPAEGPRCQTCTVPAICYRHEPPFGALLCPEDNGIKSLLPPRAARLSGDVEEFFQLDEIVAVQVRATRGEREWVRGREGREGREGVAVGRGACAGREEGRWEVGEGAERKRRGQTAASATLDSEEEGAID